jgi:gas vesicle protein
MSERDTNVGNILIAFAAGAVVGAGIALLYAPQSGAETRRLIAERAEELKNSTAEKFGEFKGSLKERREQLSAAFEAGKEGYRDAKNRNSKESEAPLG